MDDYSFCSVASPGNARCDAPPFWRGRHRSSAPGTRSLTPGYLPSTYQCSLAVVVLNLFSVYLSNFSSWFRARRSSG
jgi:hypothetical protein